LEKRLRDGMRKFKVPQAEKGSIALHCEFLNIDGKMKPCSLDPHECVMGFRGMVSEDGLTFTPIEQPSIEATLRNCPKLKNQFTNAHAEDLQPLLSN